MFSGGVAESEKSESKMVSETVAVCVPLVPLTVKLKGFAVAALRLLSVSVLVWPAKIDAGLKEHVVPEEQERVMVPVKLLPEADTVKVAEVVPTTIVVDGVGEERLNCAIAVPERATV